MEIAQQGFSKSNRNAVCYLIFDSNGAFQAAKEEEEECDDFFEQTAQDLKYRQKDLARQSGIETSRPFLPRSFLVKKNRERKAESYKHTVIRFSFNNTFIVQALFCSSEPVSNLFEFVNELLSNSPEDKRIFNLYFSLELLAENNTKSLLEVGIAPMSKLTVQLFTDCSPEKWLEEFADKTKLVDVAQADDISKEWLSINTDYILFEHTLIITESLNGSAAAVKRIANKISGIGKQNQNSMNDKQEDVPKQPVNYNKYSTPRSEFPKWFKGKN